MKKETKEPKQRLVSRAAIGMARRALQTLGKEDLLFTHHGDVHARPEAYARLAESFEDFAKDKAP